MADRPWPPHLILGFTSFNFLELIEFAMAFLITKPGPGCLLINPMTSTDQSNSTSVYLLLERTGGNYNQPASRSVDVLLRAEENYKTAAAD